MALLAALRRSRRIEPTPVEPAEETPAEAPPAPGENAAGAFDMIEEDLRRVRDLVGAATRDMGRAVDAAAADAAVIVSDADGLAATVAAAHADVDAVAAAFSDITSAGEQIEREIGAARRVAEDAQAGAQRAGDGVKELDAAIARIESVVDLIAKVARQTTLLALNATIEAERAGAAGRGFAVVAGEVKALSVETQRATDEINANIQSLQAAARNSVGAVGKVVEAMDRLGPTFAAVSDAVTRQVTVVGEAATLSDRTRVAVDGAASRAAEMRERSVAVSEGAAGVRRSADRLSATTGSTTDRLMTVLRQTRLGDRRAHDRFPAFLPATLRIQGRALASETVDVGEGGLLLKAPDGDAPVGARVEVDLDQVARLPARIVARSPQGVHLAFEALDAERRDALLERIARIRETYDELIDRARQTADQIGSIFEESCRRGEISADALFDTAYRPIAGTDPLQVETASLAYLEKVLQPIQEQLLASDRRMAFCAAVDRNGYLPVHNLVFSKPQRPGDVVWNTANCRNRRIFDDRAGLLAARNTRPFLVQAYRRDMGGGVTVMMKEVDAPITVNGRHWGGFRTAYKT